VLNELDRFHLANEVIERVPGLGVASAPRKQGI
jgi:phosphoketolase